MPTPLAPTAMRQVNRGATLRRLAAHRDPVTLATLANETGLSRRTVELILTELMTSGWAEESGPGEPSGAGRPARRFAFNPRTRYVLAAQIDTHFAHVVLADLRGDTVGRLRRGFESNEDPERTTAILGEAITELLAREGVAPAEVAAGTIAQGGTVRRDGSVHEFAPKPRWVGFSAAATLSASLGIPFRGENDANLCALAEQERGVAQGEESFVWLIAGRRSGAGIVLNGALHRGVAGSAGELVLAPQLGLDVLEQHLLGGLTSADESARAAALAIVDGARGGDAEACAAIEAFAEVMADAIVTLSWILAPRAFVLGYGLEAAADLLIPILERRLEGRTPPMRLAASELDGDAALLGGISRSLAAVEAELYGPQLQADPEGAAAR